MLFVFCQLALTDMRQAIVFIVLREVESNLLTIGRDAHGYETVDQLVAQPTHGEGIDKDYDDGQQMVEENNEAFPCAGYEALLYEDAR